jgi:hypothetical protein
MRIDFEPPLQQRRFGESFTINTNLRESVREFGGIVRLPANLVPGPP